MRISSGVDMRVPVVNLWFLGAKTCPPSPGVSACPDGRTVSRATQSLPGTPTPNRAFPSSRIFGSVFTTLMGSLGEDLAGPRLLAVLV
ncbi:hypothetical protein BDV25DRAFT_152159 [Aspergillus avenaceus]|uniref:Uncharacterized protein n=1 Tax=Aspergillus avenaceus TaxID=36643 RepID=A0A5N6TZH6_ASPAV|nr:hypothetical protein BDV25DRAFT_152159 [Aspergillus avenaceus]